MGEIYRKGSTWYAPKWRNPRSGREIPAHSLGTPDSVEAEIRWTMERARELAAFAPSERQPTFAVPGIRRVDRLSQLFELYIETKRNAVAAPTLAAYQQYARLILRRLDDWGLDLVGSPAGSDVLERWARAEVERLDGRTHTVAKWLEAIVKPALRYAFEQRMIGVLPIFPNVRNDYMGEGRRELELSPEEFAQLWHAVPEVDVCRTKRGEIKVWPRAWLDLAVATGLHAADLDRFPRKYFRKDGRQWFRRNSKGARHYKPAWLPTDEILQGALERVLFVRGELADDDLLVAAAPPPVQWMRPRLEAAAKAARLPQVPAPLDFRHTFACWKRNDLWEFDEVAKWLANSSGMVERVYANVPPRRMQAAAEKSRAAGERLTELLANPPAELEDGAPRAPERN